MKNKGVLFSILFILFLGIFITINTRRLVTAGGESAPSTYNSPASSSVMPGNSAQAAGAVSGASNAAVFFAEEKHTNLPGSAEAVNSDSPAPHSEEGILVREQGPLAADAGDAAPQAAAVAEPDGQAAVAEISEEAHAATVYEDSDVTLKKERSIVEISPLTGSDDSGQVESAVALTGTDYLKKLQELDIQIKKMKESGIEPNTNSYKNVADYEYRLWDNELNTIYQDILGRMTAEDAEALRLEEREWMNLRDQTAHKASAKYSGGTLESLEYTASLAYSTRSRAYELVEKYGTTLEP